MRRLLKASLVALAIAGWMVIGLEASELPILDVCDFLTNEWLRWLAGCPPLDSGAN
jgi:hypothetical protein